MPVQEPERGRGMGEGAQSERAAPVEASGRPPPPRAGVALYRRAHQAEQHTRHARSTVVYRGLTSTSPHGPCHHSLVSSIFVFLLLLYPLKRSLPPLVHHVPHMAAPDADRGVSLCPRCDHIRPTSRASRHQISRQLVLVCDVWHVTVASVEPLGRQQDHVDADG